MYRCVWLVIVDMQEMCKILMMQEKNEEMSKIVKASINSEIYGDLGACDGIDEHWGSIKTALGAWGRIRQH